MSSSVRWAFVVATTLALLTAIGSLLSPSNLVTALIFGAGAFGLWRRWAWCGFGLALITAMTAMNAVVLLFRQNLPVVLRLALPVLMVSAVAAWVFYRAGRALKQGPMRIAGGLPWIAIAVFQGVVLIVGLRSTFYVNPTGSMENSLLIGDYFVVSHDMSVARGDLIVFGYPVDESQTFIKRVVGLPGDRIRIVNKQLVLNGASPKEPYALHGTDYMDSYRDNFPSQSNIRLEARAQQMLAENVVNGEVVVPADSYFVLGDNRDNSLDSRYWGFVPRTNFIGKPYIVYWSYDDPVENVVDTLRYELPWKSLKRVRWERVFMPIHGYPLQ